MEQMEIITTASIALAATIILGLLLGSYFYKRRVKRNQAELEEKSKRIIKEAELQAENIKKDRIIEAKEKLMKMKQEFEDEANRKKSQIITNEQKVKQREAQLNKELEQIKRKEADIDEERQSLAQQHELVKKRKEELDKFNTQKVALLEGISKLTADQARDQLVESMKEEAQTKASSYIKDIMEQAKLSATKEAKKIIVETIQRTASEQAVENCVSIFNIESDDIKGKIIGREGRNIRTLEAATGAQLKKLLEKLPDGMIYGLALDREDGPT